LFPIPLQLFVKFATKAQSLNPKVGSFIFQFMLCFAHIQKVPFAIFQLDLMAFPNFKRTLIFLKNLHNVLLFPQVHR